MKTNQIITSIITLALSGVSFTGFAVGRYEMGHGDVRPYYEGGQLKVRYQLDYNAVVDGAEVSTFEAGAVSYSLGSLVTYIPDAPFPMPDLPEFSFIGANLDDPLWFIPEVQETDRPWLGLSTEELDFGDWSGDVVQMSLVSVTGPVGSFFSMFDSGNGFTPRVFMTTLDGINGSDQYYYQSPGNLILGISVSTHAHVNWMFTQPGEYEVLLKFSGEHLTDGYKEVFAPIAFQVAVVPEPSTMALLAMGGAGLLAWRRKNRN